MVFRRGLLVMKKNIYMYIYIYKTVWLVCCLVSIIGFNFQRSIPLWGARELLSVGEKPERFLSSKLLRGDCCRPRQQLHT